MENCVLRLRLKKSCRRYTLLIASAAWLLGACASIRTAQNEGAASRLRPKLVWSKTFEGVIYHIGINEDCLEVLGGNLDSCIKWAQLADRRSIYPGQSTLWWFDRGRRIGREPTEDFSGSHLKVYDKHILISSGLGESLGQYRLLDSDGREVWEFESEYGFRPFVRRDGSAVLIREERERRKVARTIALFLGDDGAVTAEDTIESSAVPPCISEGFCMLAGGGRGRLYNRTGDVLWDREFPRQSPILVTDTGLALFRSPPLTHSPLGGVTVVYNLSGDVQDTIPFALGLVPVRAFGNMVFSGVYEFVGYDLDVGKQSLALKPEDGYHFGYFDVDPARNLLVIAVHRDPGIKVVAGAGHLARVLNIYDLSGSLLSQVPLELGIWIEWHQWIPRTAPLPFRLIGGKLLVHEGKYLKLYDLGLD